MDYFNGFVVFVLTWWVVIFTVLPWGNTPAQNVAQGTAPSAPANPRIKQKLFWTTVISLIITAIIMTAIKQTDFSFRDLSDAWPI